MNQFLRLSKIFPRELLRSSRLPRSGVKLYGENVFWHFSVKAVGLISSLISIGFVARHLEPNGLGSLSFAQSVTALAATVVGLGLDEILLRDLKRFPNRIGQLLGSTIILRAGVACLGFILVSLFSLLLLEDPALRLVSIIVAGSLFFHPLLTFSNFFNAYAFQKHIAYLSLGVNLAFPIIRILAVLVGVSLYGFAALIVVEVFLQGAVVTYVYRRLNARVPEAALRWSYEEVKQLVRSGLPVFATSFVNILSVTASSLIVVKLLDSHALGLLEASKKLSETWAFVHGSLIMALTPALTNMYVENPRVYYARLRALFALIALTTAGLASLIFLLADFLVPLIYGNDFTDAILLTQIYVWSVIPAALVGVLNRHLIISHQEYLFFAMYAFAAVVQIGVGYWFTKHFGLIGLAVATIIGNGAMLLFYGVIRLRKFIQP